MQKRRFDRVRRIIRQPRSAEFEAKWLDLVDELLPMVAASKDYHLHTNYPVTSSGMSADIVVEGPEEVIIIEHLQPMAGTAQVSTAGLPMAKMAMDSAQELFPNKRVRFVYYPTVEVPDSIRHAITSLGAEIAEKDIAPGDFVRGNIIKGHGA